MGSDSASIIRGLLEKSINRKERHGSQRDSTHQIFPGDAWRSPRFIFRSFYGWFSRVAVLALFLPSLPALAQRVDSLSMLRLINGYYWRELDGVEKRITVQGARCGIVTFDTILAGMAARDTNIAKSMKPWDPVDTATFPDDDIAAQITTFYRDSINMRVPIPAAYLYAVHKLAGESKEKLKQLLAPWRK